MSRLVTLNVQVGLRKSYLQDRDLHHTSSNLLVQPANNMIHLSASRCKTGGEQKKRRT